MDEIQALVIENGSAFMKVGFAGDDCPRGVFPTVYGRFKHLGIMSPPSRTSFTGDEAISKQGVLNLTNPIRNGVVSDWGLMEKIWHHTFYNELRVPPEEHPVLLTEAPLTPKESRERMIKIMFETFNVPALHVINAPTLALYGSGRTTGVVVSSGGESTYIVPIHEGYLIPSAVQNIPLGGNDINDYLAMLLGEGGYHLTSIREKLYLNDIKEKLCYVASDYDAELQLAKDSDVLEKIYETESTGPVHLKEERFKCTELFFSPNVIAKNEKGIHELVHKAITTCQEEIRANLFSNIILCGGNAMFEGLGRRLCKEISSLSETSVKIKVHSIPERKFLKWIGGSILASLSTFESMWFLRDDYDQNGAESLHAKCF